MAINLVHPEGKPPRQLTEEEKTRVIAERAAAQASRAADRVDNLAAEIDEFRADVMAELGAISSALKDKTAAQQSTTRWSALVVGTIPVLIAILQAFGVLDP